jgi:glycosyltransferase involved in cell wall biosynthesis
VRIHTTFVTYNRLELTKQAIESYLSTIEIPFTYNVIDNGSEDGTIDWLIKEKHPHEFLWRNFYPGYATNRGWEQAPDNATLLHRADNDMRFLPGWCEHVEKILKRKRRLGQLGLRTAEEERHCAVNTGGNCIVRRILWNKGLRWDERAWRRYPAGMSEDTYFSPEVIKYGFSWDRVTRPCLEMLSPDFSETELWEDDPYYVKAFADRRIGPRPRRRRHARRAR